MDSSESPEMNENKLFADLVEMYMQMGYMEFQDLLFRDLLESYAQEGAMTLDELAEYQDFIRQYEFQEESQSFDF